MKNTKLENNIRSRLRENEVQLMTHMVLGYPSFEANLEALELMREAGVRLTELQIPFSEPIADGPVIMKACQDSLRLGTDPGKCFEFAEKVTGMFPDHDFLFMSYLNIPFRLGFAEAARKSVQIGIKGWIVPDLPPEAEPEYIDAFRESGLATIFIFTPNSTRERLKQIDSYSTGMVYGVARRGVTGKKTEFDAELENTIRQYKKNTDLPLGIGFGISSKQDIDFLKGKSDIAVIGSKLIQLYDQGPSEVRAFFKEIK